MLGQEPKNSTTNPQLQKYYKYLRDNNADVPPTYSSFENTLKDPKSAQGYYDYLKKNNFDAPETFDSFQSTFGLKKKDSTSISTTSGKSSASGQEVGSSGTVKQSFRLPTEKEFEEGQKRGEFAPNSSMPKSKETQYDLEGNTGKVIPETKKTLPKLPTKEELQKEQEKGFYTKGEENVKRQEISKDFEEKGFTENTKQKFIDGNLVTEEKRVFSKDKEQLKLDIDTQIAEEDLDNPVPFKFYSTYDKQPIYNPATRTFTEVAKDPFVDSEFGDEKLKAIGIDPADFDGYLNEKGFKKDFLEKEEKGLFDGEGRNLSGADIQLAREIQKQKMFANYIAEKNERDFKVKNLNAKKENLDRSSTDAVKVERTTIFEPNKIENYLENEFPLLSKKLKERDEESRKILEQHNKGEAGIWYGTKNTLKSGWNGFVDRINNLSATVYDKIGMDETAEEVRMMHEENQLLKPDTREVGYVSGKSVKYDGVEYLVDENGQIYDKDKKIRVTDLMLKPAYESILRESKKGKEDWIFSPQGTAMQLGGVLGDMIVQVALTRGIGGAISSPGISQISNLSKLSKIPISKDISSAIIAQSSLGYSQGLEETIKAAKDAGLNDNEAEMLANDAAQRMAILYAVTAPISPQTKATESLFGNAEKDLIRKAILSYRENGKKGFVETLKNGIPKLAKAGTEISEEGLKEFFQENIQQTGEALLVNKETNKQAGKEILKDSISVDDFINRSILSFASGGLITQMKLPTLFKNNNVEQLRTLNTLSQDYSKFEQNLDNLVKNGSVDSESAEKLKKDVKIFSSNKNKIPTDTKPEVALDLMRGLDEISKLENKKKTLDASFHENINEQIKSKREEIKSLYNQSNPNAVQQEATITEVEQETQPQAEVQETEQEVLVTPTAKVRIYEYNGKKYNITDNGGVEILSNGNENMIPLDLVEEIEKNGNYLGAINNIEVLNETTPTIDTTTNGDIRPRIEPMAEVGGTTEQTTENSTTESIPQTTEPTTSKRETKRVVSKTIKRPSTGEAAEFDVDIVDGQVVEIRKPRTGKVVPKFVEIKDKATKKVKRIQRNANWTAIADEALGQRTNNDIAKEDKKATEQAIQSFEPSNEYEHALQFFATGGNVNSQSAQRETGLSNKEVKWATGFKPDSKLPSVEAIAEKIVMDAEKSGVSELDMQEVRNALIDIIKSYTRDSVKQEIVDTQKSRQEAKEKSEEDTYLNSLTQDEYNEYQRLKAETLIERADQEFLESMSENDIRDYYEQLYNEQQQSEQQYYETEQQQGEQRNEEQIGSTEISSVQEIQGESKSERLTDQINDILDDFDKRLRDFGNETLGINIPVVIARGAIKAMKLANNGVATLEDVVQAGIDYIKSTDWYANLSDVNKTAIDKNTFMSVLDSTIKANDAAKKTIESLRQKIQDNKTNSKQIVADIKNFLANNSIDGVLTPAQANALITKANEILTAKDTLKAFDSFVEYYNKVKDKAENKLNEKAKAKLRYEKQKQRVLDLKSQGKSLSQTISTLEAEKGKPLSEKEKQMVELIFKTGDVANMTDNDVNQVVDGALEKSREAVRKSNNGWTKLKEKFKGLRAKFLDAQADAKRIIKSNQLGTVLDRLIALKGASAKAEMVFNEAKEKIYSGLKTEQRKVLDDIIMLRRILAIDENRAKKGLTPVLHPDFITGEIAKRKLEIIKDKIGDEAYSELDARANIYFDEFRNILNEMQKSGLISQKTRDELFDVDYQPRKFLHYLMNGDEEISENAKSWQKSTFSLSGDQIKALEEGSIEPLVLDSEWLLATAMSMRYKSIFMNALNSKLASEFNKKEAEIKALKAIPENQRTKSEKKKIAEFEKMKEAFIDNPIIGVTKSSNPKYKFDTTPAGYRIAYYYKNGVQNKFFIKENIYEQWYNEKKFINNPKLLENLSIISGSKLLKAMATGKNPFFLITNIPRDFMSVMLISPEYSKFKLLAIGQLFKDLGKSFMAIKNKNDMFEKYFEYGGGMSFLSTEGMLTGKSFVTDLMESKSHNKIVATLLDAKVKENAVKWLNNITLNEINQYSELIFRISVFNRSIQNQLKKLEVSDINDIEDIIDSEGNIIATKKEQQDDIYFRAVASARSIMDFNQGGYITKDMESVMPYLNAATQGSRVLFDAFAERPFETTSNILQLTTIGITSAIGASLAAIAMFSDEDEERSSMEIYLDNMSMVSPHDRRNNFIIFTGKKDEEGNPIYIKIAKAQQITPFTVISEHIVLNKFRRDYGMKEDGKLFEKSLDAINDNISPIQWLSFREDPTLIGVSLIARNPFGRAAMTYTTGYDFYRQEKLSWDIDKKGVPKYMEGYSSDRVDDFYKEIGMDLEMSPVRMKAMVESVLTSPSTNPYLGIMYGGLDAAITDKSFKEKSQVALENTLKNVSKRITNVGKPYNKTLEEKEELKKKIEVIQAENIIFNAKIDDIAKDYINKKDNKEVFRNKLIKELKLEPFKADRAVNRIVDKIKFKDVDPFYIDLKYEQDNEVKALMLFNHLGDVKKLKMEDRKKIVEQLEKIGFKLNEEIANEYMKFVREYEER